MKKNKDKKLKLQRALLVLVKMDQTAPSKSLLSQRASLSRSAVRQCQRKVSDLETIQTQITQPEKDRVSLPDGIGIGHCTLPTVMFDAAAEAAVKAEIR